MSNEYYTPSGSPTTNSDGSSAVMRAEFASIQAGLDKLPVLAANGDKAVFVNAGGTALTAVTAATARTNIGAQASDATLTSLSALGTAADKVAYTTGVDTWAETSLTAAGRALIDDASAAAQRTTLGSTSVGDAVFIAASTAAARTAIEAAGTGVANTFVGGQSVGNGTAATTLMINGSGGTTLQIIGNTGSARLIDFFSGASLRARLIVSSTAESGGNAGSDVRFDLFDDAAALITNAVQIKRSTGAIIFGNPTGSYQGGNTLNAVNLYVQGSAVLKQADIFVSADQTITLAGSLTLAHGLGAAPRLWSVVFVCVTAELGYSIGDVVSTGSAQVPAIWPDATNLNARYSNTAVSIAHKTTGVLTAITSANWKARFLALK